jgi:L-rhamnose mutarotase
MRYALALDLRDDLGLIQQYETYHRDVWPEVIAHLRNHGVLGVEIFRLCTRLLMLMETDDEAYDAAQLAARPHGRPQETNGFP